MRISAESRERRVEPQTNETKDRPRILLLVSRSEEAQRLRQRLAAHTPDFELVFVPGLVEAQSYVAAARADAVVCDLTALAEEPDQLPWNLGVRVPWVALVSPGREEQAARLLAEGMADCVVKVGNYHLLLAATLRRVARSPTLAQSLTPARPGTPLDGEEIGKILRHEINNPLTGILGNAELILAAEADINPEVRRRVETIVDLAVRLRDLIRNLEQMVTR